MLIKYTLSKKNKKPLRITKGRDIIITIRSLDMRYHRLKQMLQENNIDFKTQLPWKIIFERLEKNTPMYIRITRMTDGSLSLGYSNLEFLEYMPPNDLVANSDIYELDELSI